MTDRDLLLKVYDACNSGYNNRDDLVQDQFGKIISTVQIFLAGILALGLAARKLYADGAPWEWRLAIAGVGVLGLVCLFALHLDLCSNASYKAALKSRARAIETELGLGETGMWGTVEGRGRFVEEAAKRGIKRLHGAGTEGDLFVWASRLLLVVWAALVAAMALLGIFPLAS